jgi:uncharacterized protein (DUF427 family)
VIRNQKEIFGIVLCSPLHLKLPHQFPFGSPEKYPKMSPAATSNLASDFAATKSRLNTLASKLIANPPRVEGTARRVRVLFNKKIVADTTSAKFVWEHPYYPHYYLPANDVQTKYIEKVEKTESGEGHICRLVVGDRSAGSVLWFEKGILDGLIKFEFKEMGMLVPDQIDTRLVV